MKKLLLSLMLLVAATVTVCAQDVPVQTEPPVIVCDVDEWFGVANIFAYGEGEVHLYIGDTEVENPYSVSSPDCYGLIMDVVAIAHVEGQIDGLSTAECIIPSATTLMGDIVIGDVEEDGRIFVAYIGGNEPVFLYVTVNGMETEVINNYITVGEGESVIDVQVFGGRTCQNEAASKTVTYTVTPSEPSDYPNFKFTTDEYELYRFDVTIESPSSEAVLYYRYAADPWVPDIESAEWSCVEGGHCMLSFDWRTQEYQFIFQAYAVEPGKLPSPTVEANFANRYDLYRRYVKNYDFMVDGIYYMKLTDSTVAVSSEMIETTHGIDLLFPDQYNGRPITYYYGDVIIPSTVEYGGTTYTVKSVNPFAFVESELSSVVLPNTITTIGKGAFYGTTISSLVLPEGLIECGIAAFADCKGLSEVVIPNALTSMSASMFLCCEDLTSVTIGQSVTIVNEGVFLGCPSVAKVVCLAPTPPMLDLISNAFETYHSATLFVPNESLEAYRAHEEWGQFYRIVPFLGAGPGDVNGDGKIAISDVTNLINQLLASGEMPAFCDVNGDGKVSIADVSTLIEMLLNGN